MSWRFASVADPFIERPSRTSLHARHLDFRLSVPRQMSAEGPSAVVSTVCTTHNTCGRLYLLVVIPFHKWGVQRLMSRALARGRL